jgi:hypothetical protein
VQVGKDLIWDKTVKKRVLLKYSHIPKDVEGFVTELRYLPIARDLLYLRRRGKDKTINGWWDGRKWYGLRLKKEDIITAWKRNFADDRAID